MKSVVFFNNKGGVGKTTLACNVVSYLAKRLGKRVLLVDADPQCNATQAIMTESYVEAIYADGASGVKTLHSYLRPIEVGDPSIDRVIIPLPAEMHRYGTDLIPGHPNMSIVEDQLSSAWSDLIGAKIGGMRITNWCHQLLDSLVGPYDIVVFDVGPSLGALNRTIILSSDYIVTPFGSDIFSLLGIKNISTWIHNWDKQYLKAIDNIRDSYGNTIDDFNPITDTSKKFRFAGYSVQQYVTRKFKSGPRAVASYDRIIREIPETAEAAMDTFRPANLSSNELKLGDVPFVYSLVPMSQASHTPIVDLTGSEGIRGNQYGQVKTYEDLISALCEKLLHNIGES
jgi:cellulose biosynthesis protein BcsQ